MIRIYDWSFQTPNQRKAEAASIGLDIDIVDTHGGATPNTGWRLHFPPEKTGSVHYETRKFAIDSTPSTGDRWQFGFSIRFDTVDNAGGEPDFVFWGLRRNGLPDVELELAAHIDGHILNILDADGVTRASKVNAFTEDTDHWIEIALHPDFVIVKIDGAAVIDGQGDYKGDETGDYDAYFRWESQIDASPGVNNTAFWIGPAYAGENGASGDLIGASGHEVYTVRHIDTTADKGCDELGTFPGNAEDLTLGVWTNAADDTASTNAKYTSHATNTVGSIKEMGGPGGDHRPDHVFDGCKYVYVYRATALSGPKLGWGTRRSTSNYLADTASVGTGFNVSFEKWLLPGASPAPEIPHEKDLAASGHFLGPSVSNDIFLKEAYFFYFGKRSQLTTGWPVKLVQREHHVRGMNRGMMRGVSR